MDDINQTSVFFCATSDISFKEGVFVFKCIRIFFCGKQIEYET